MRLHRPRSVTVSAVETAFTPSSRLFRCTLGPNQPRPAIPTSQRLSRRYLHCSTPLPSSQRANDETPLSHNARELHSSARAAAQAQAQPFPVDDEVWGPPIYDYDSATDAYGEYDLSPAAYDQHVAALEDHSIVYEEDLPLAPTDEYDPTAPPSATKRRRRKKPAARDIPPLPPLPAGELPPDGSSRFDWRETSLSSRPQHPTGSVWYPSLRNAWRTKADMKQLDAGDTFHDETKRYTDQYVHAFSSLRVRLGVQELIGSFAPLLQAEYDEEERSLMHRLKDWSDDRLHREGVMLDDLAATPFTPHKRVDKQIVTFSKAGQASVKALPFHKLDTGSYVFLSRTSPLVDPVLENGSVGAIRDPQALEQEGQEGDLRIAPSEWLKATVWSRGKNFVRLSLPTPVSDLTSGRWRLDLGMSDWALQMQLKAMKALHNDPIEQDVGDMMRRSYRRSLPPSNTGSGTDSEDVAIDTVLAELDRSRGKEYETILDGTSIRDILLRAFQTDYQPIVSNGNTAANVVPEASTMKPTDIDATPLPTPHAAQAPRGVLARDQLIQSWTRRYRSPRALQIEGDPDIPLNSSQLRAIAMMLSERVSLVQGPPGTGKTRVIVETIKLLKQQWKIPHPILVCAHTNVAVDNLLDGLRDPNHEVKAVRAGNVDKVPDHLQEYTVDRLAEKHPLFPKLDALRTEKQMIDRLISEGGPDKGSDYAHLKAVSTQLREQIYGLDRIINREILLSADVICTTCLSSASRKLEGIDFPIVFFDEASMATEPLSIVPLMKGSSHVAIIGDHKQLPPVIISPEAHAGGLATSLFERLIHEKHIPSIMLDTQYRMHPAISAFPNKAFYASALSDGTASSDLQPPETAYLLPDRNVTFIDHDHPESPQMSSLANYGDASIVASIVADLLIRNPDLRGSQIGIIAPYTAQVRLISDYLLVDPDRQAAFADILGPERTQQLAEIEVKTVDGFEGREKDVIICSMVRCNPAGYVGFLGDWRRLNVALTRAKRALLIVGSSSTLGKAKVGKFASETLPQGGDRVLRDHIRHLKTEGLIMRAD